MRLSLRLRGYGINFPATRRGAIAQLAERLDRTQEVGGSNPPSSIYEGSLQTGDFVIRGNLNQARKDDGKKSVKVHQGRY